MGDLEAEPSTVKDLTLSGEVFSLGRAPTSVLQVPSEGVEAKQLQSDALAVFAGSQGQGETVRVVSSSATVLQAQGGVPEKVSVSQSVEAPCEGPPRPVVGVAAEASAVDVTMMEPRPGSSSFAECLALLRSSGLVEWGSRSTRPCLADASSKQTGYWNFGVQVRDRSAVTSVTRNFPEVVRALNGFLKQWWPTGTWNAVCVSLCVQTLPHRDLANLPGSLNYNVALGDFRDGQLWLEEPTGDVPCFIRELGVELSGRLVCTKETPFAFNGALWHATMPWQGERWALTAYTLPEVSPAALAGLNFPHQTVEIPRVSESVHVPTPAAPRFFLDICSGYASPLSQALKEHGVPVLSIDVLLDASHDLLQDAFYEKVLRICFSGKCSMAHGSPPCGEYSRLKLMDKDGPPPVRSPEFLDGLPDNTPVMQEKVLTSFTLLSRTVQLLMAVYQSGGHTSLEQPRNAMSWLEPVVRRYLQEVSADVNVVAACMFGMPYLKHWIFASSWRPLQALACVCPHGRDAHHKVLGQRDADGTYVSRQTALYPARLAEVYAEKVLPLFPAPAEGVQLSIPDAVACIPTRPLKSFPRASQDGGGIYSVPDWAEPQPGVEDVFSGLRPQLQRFMLENKIPNRLSAQTKEASTSPLFTEAEVSDLREIWNGWFKAQGHEAPAWDVPEGQPYALHALRKLAQVMHDPDEALWPALLAGVPTGVRHDIPASGVFVPVASSAAPALDEHDFLLCTGNWKGAEDDPALLERLLEKEVQAGFLEEVPDLQTAQDRWPQLAIGKANIVHALGRDPRLIIDPTVSGLNPACHIPEKFCLPGLHDVQCGVPIRGSSAELAACTLDISAAHKTMRVRESERGLLGVRLGKRLFLYRVAPFGAKFSAHWWQRLAAFFVRCSHRLIWVAHILMMYVDDALLYQDAQMLPVSAAVVIGFCQTFGFPLSWRKLQLAATVQFIGWELHFRAEAFCLPAPKVQKLLEAVNFVLKATKLCRKDLERIIGLLHWVVQISPTLRPWLCSLYHDMERPLATNFSFSAFAWQQLPTCLDSDMIFSRTPPGTSIRVGSRLLSVRHVDVKCKADLTQVQFTGKRLWARVADPTTDRRKLSSLSISFLSFWRDWCEQPQILRPLNATPFEPSVKLAADACASGQNVGIGGWVEFPGQPRLWFAERFEVSDFSQWGISMQSPANLDIVCYETLAQIALVHVFATSCVGGRCRVRIPSWSDNTGTEAVCTKLFTTVQPLAAFVQQLAIHAWRSHVELDTSHISGCHNDKADFLSRWDGVSALPEEWLPAYRVSCALPVLWAYNHDIRLFPPEARLLWELPLNKWRELSQ